MRKKIWETFKISLIIAGLFGGQVAAQTSSSQSYQTNEYMFGSGGELDSQSESYRGQSSVGALGVDSSASESYNAEAGFLTPSEPFLEMVVADNPVDLGELTETETKWGAAQGGGCNCSFNVRAYLSSEYVVMTASDPPTNESGDVLAAKTTQGAPLSGPTIEEFGINLVANTLPGVMGNGPQNVPDGNFADGMIATGYEVANQYKYGVGDIIARSPATAGTPAVGQTNYTISYIAKTSSLTPAGVYQMDHVLVVVATF